MANKYVKDLLSSVGSEYAKMSDDYFEEFDCDEYIDTGCYALNALLGGSVFSGLPLNKITAFAGEQATGKTFFVLSIIESYLKNNEDATVFFFESESAITRNMLETRGIDTDRVIILPVDTIEDFRTQSSRLLDKVKETPDDKRTPILLVLDSLGMLSTKKETGDSSDGSDKRDMTRTPLIRSTFRVLTNRLGRLKIPLIVTNHTYDNIGGYGDPKTMGGGGGLKYAASTIVFLSKSKDKEGTEVVGNIIRAKLNKGRLTRENSEVKVRLSYDTGLDPYYGLVEFAVASGIWKKIATRIEIEDGKKVYAKTILENPDEYFNENVMAYIDEYCKEKFLYGSDLEEVEDESAEG